MDLLVLVGFVWLLAIYYLFKSSYLKVKLENAEKKIERDANIIGDLMLEVENYRMILKELE